MSDDIEDDLEKELDNQISFKPAEKEAAPRVRDMEEMEKDAERYTD